MTLYNPSDAARKIIDATQQGSVPRIQTHQPGQSDVVFGNVYKRLRKHASYVSDTEHAKKLISDLREGIDKHGISGIDSSNLTDENIFFGIRSQLDLAAKYDFVLWGSTLRINEARGRGVALDGAGFAYVQSGGKVEYDSEGKPKLRKKWWETAEAKKHFNGRVQALEKEGVFSSRKNMEEFVNKKQVDPARGRGIVDSYWINRKTGEKWGTVLEKHVRDLLRKGGVSHPVAKVFLDSLTSLGEMSSEGEVINYDAMIDTGKHLVGGDSDQKKRAYRKVVGDYWNEQPKEKKLGEDYWLHFNNHLGGIIKNRLYISADVSQEPHKVIEHWRNSLDETGLREKICFKIPADLKMRHESIVAYLTDQNTDSEIEQLLSSFTRNCPQELLSRESMPTGIPLQRGIAMGAHPQNIDRLSKYCHSGGVTYNQLITSLMKLSFELAYWDMTKYGGGDPRPREMKDFARDYFTQMLKLAGINADTMMPNSQGGVLPNWAERIKAK